MFDYNNNDNIHNNTKMKSTLRDIHSLEKKLLLWHNVQSNEPFLRVKGHKELLSREKMWASEGARKKEEKEGKEEAECLCPPLKQQSNYDLH